MAHLISWVYCNKKHCFIFKTTNGRKLLIEKVSRVLRLESPILYEAYKQDVPLNNVCEQSQELMRKLRRKFEPVEVDPVEKARTTVVWWTFLETGHVKIMFMNGVNRWKPAAELLTHADVRVLEQLNLIPPRRSKPSPFLSQFEMDLALRIDELKALHGSTEDEDDGYEGFYYSEAMTEEDYYG